MNSTSVAPDLADEGQPTWEIARLFPNQGSWSEGDYFSLCTNRFVEFSDGFVEVLAPPTTGHQMVLGYVIRVLAAHAEREKLGLALIGPFCIRLWPGKFRQPDIALMLASNSARRRDEWWEGSDLVMEVVGEDRERDLVLKRGEYAKAGIPEYWIVDPAASRITVLRLDAGKYTVHGEFSPGQQATSWLLDGFAVDVAAVFSQQP